MPREGGEGRAGGPHAALATLNGDRDYKVPAQLITIDRNPSTSLRLARPKTTPPVSKTALALPLLMLLASACR
jgi:hypothetical protein